MEQDRRNVNRLPVPRVLVKISTPERMRVAYLKDLSEGGVFIRTDKPLALERVVDVDLLAPGRAEPLRLRGRITRVQNDEASRLANLQGMGVKFIELSAQTDAALKQLVQEYTQARPAVPAQSTVPDADTVALKQALETGEVLRTTLIEREAELKAEHDRRQELSVRVIALTQELEGVKARGSDGQSVALEALKVELSASRAEVAELKSRLEAAETNAESYRQEIASLEQADTQTRRLAETLAQGKQKSEAELKRAREELANQARTVENERSSGFARSAETSRLLEAERGRRAEAEKKCEELAAQNAGLQNRARELEPMLEQARKHVSGMGQTVSDLTAARTRVDTLEKALAEERAKSARLATRERELRQLVAAISAKGDDVVVMDEGGPEVAPSPPRRLVDAPPAATPVRMAAISTAIGDAIGHALGDVPPGSTMIMARLPPLAASPVLPPQVADPFADNVPVSQTLVVMTMPEAEEETTSPQIASLAPSAPSVPSVPSVASTDPGPPPPPVADEAALMNSATGELDALNVDVDAVDVDVDWGGQAIAVAPQPGETLFLDRLRSNDKLVRRAAFFEYSAADKDEEKVIGSLMGGDRYEDLKVLSRGQCSPEQLESHLLKFHQLGLIGFDA